MALKPDGKSARTERVSFTRPAAERIAQVVRKVEAGDRDSAGLRFPRPIGAGGGEPKAFRICTFTGAWAIGSSKSVEFKYQSTTPNTVSATNLFFEWPGASSTKDCAIARDGTAWFLIDVPMETASAVFVTGTAAQAVPSSYSDINVVTGISIGATLNTTNCTITVAKTETTTSVKSVSATTNVSVITSSATASFLRFKVA